MKPKGTCSKCEHWELVPMNDGVIYDQLSSRDPYAKDVVGLYSMKLDSYDWMFPNQDTLPKGGFSNLIALPLQGQARRKGNSSFIDEQFRVHPD